MKYFFLICFLNLFQGSSGQSSFDFAPGGDVSQGSIIFYGSDGLNKIPYNTITGIPYWKNDFLPAKLYAPGNKLYGTFWCKINLATQEVEYISKNEEILAAYPDKVSKAVFVSLTDSNQITAIFKNDIGDINVHYLSRNKRYYVQEMNQGPVKLLKVGDRELRTGDSMFRTLKRYYFVDVDEYFIQNGIKIEKLRKLNKDEVMQRLPQSPELEAWIRENNIKFNREEDILKLLEYYNQKAVKKE
jgi:hypothetical protein